MSLSAGATLDLSLVGDEGSDFDLYIYDSSTDDITSDPSVVNSRGETYPEVLTYTVPAGQGGTYYVDICAYSESGSYTLEYTITSPPAEPVTVPIEGPNRYATAIAASTKAFPSGSEYVIIATGMNWPDALGGSALAGALDAPILLTRQDILPAEVRSEIVRLGATKAIILGGTPAVSAAVAGQIDGIAGVSVERISGPNRYDTANAVAARTIAVMRAGSGYDGTAFIATGANFPDALGASPLAAAAGWPIYLANPNQDNNAGLVAVMKAAGVTDAILLGGANVVADSIRIALGTAYETRLSGANRYDTAIAVATYGVANAGLSWNRLAIATGQNFPDALAGGVLQGKSGSVLLLTPTASLNDGVR
ncbi:MAG TPA: cell wall-binding repeat-containing protein, partial [Coriobacteriia bacterium]|nr:cell wall-binding repeat-containing protein [Coriobacteriia bacterium]